jgi:hypothetical protein
MKLQILFILILCVIVFYDGYLKGPVETVYSYGRTIFGVAICLYLMYSYNKSPEDFKIALEFVKGFFLRSDNFMTKQLERIDVGKPKLGQRQVSQLMKKQVAAKQQWKCGHCQSILDASYEVDHILALYRGGSNSEENLVALCRNCHGKKTVNERLEV